MLNSNWGRGEEGSIKRDKARRERDKRLENGKQRL